MRFLFKGKVCGLCGNFNDIANDDIDLTNKLRAGSSLEFGNSWKVNNRLNNQLILKYLQSSY